MPIPGRSAPSAPSVVSTAHLAPGLHQPRNALPLSRRTFGLLRMTAKLSPSDPFFFFFFLGDLGLPPSASIAQ